jgi:hypothetical protein
MSMLSTVYFHIITFGTAHGNIQGLLPASTLPRLAGGRHYLTSYSHVAIVIFYGNEQDD